jgi:hypothetical protein
VNDGIYQHKSQTSEELSQKIVQSADHIRRNDKVIESQQILN